MHHVRVGAKRRGLTLPANFTVVHQDAMHRDAGEATGDVDIDVGVLERARTDELTVLVEGFEL